MNIKKILGDIKQDYFTFPLYIFSHPFKGFDEMKFEKKGKLSVALVLMAVFCIINIVKTSYTGFSINYENPYFMNSMFIVATTLLPIVLFVTGNWSVTTLMGGIGTYKEILMSNVYALYLSIYLNLIFVVLSNVLTLDEMPLAMFFTTISVVIYCLYQFIGLIVIHEFSFSKAIGAILLTFLAMAIIMFVAILLMTLIGEVVQFFVVICREIALKFA